MSKVAKLLTQTKAALVINEMQNGPIKMFPALKQALERHNVVANIAGLAATFRAKGLPVFHAPIHHHPQMLDIMPNSMIESIALKTQALRAGTDEVLPLPGLEPHPEDIIVLRNSGLFALIGTDMNVRLRRMGVETIVVTGISTNLGILALAMAGVDLASNVVVPEDCIAGSDQKVHDMIIAEQMRLLAHISSAQAVTEALAARA